MPQPLCARSGAGVAAGAAAAQVPTQACRCRLPSRAPRRVRGLSLPPEALILASFGHINPYKRVEAVLRSVKALRDEFADVRYVLVGSVSPNYDLAAAIARSGLDGVATATGYVRRAAFEDYVAAADICVNLRHPTAGETSAGLLRLLGAGKPTAGHRQRLVHRAAAESVAAQVATWIAARAIHDSGILSAVGRAPRYCCGDGRSRANICSA
ncbi:MAG: hypothetical protein U0074_02660 [Kouleothrix sp.]